jgi:hypothetical protein
MSLLLSVRAEILKTKRSASFWLTLIGAAFIPTILLLVYIFNSRELLQELRHSPWNSHFGFGWHALSSFLYPMYVILICTLIPQIEYKNNAWKQVFASPQSEGNIFFSKFISIHMMILFLYVMFNLFMILVGVTANLINSGYTFMDTPIEWESLLRLNFKTYISVLGISAIQYWLSWRFKNFIAPVGIGLALLIGAIISLGINWPHVFKIPFAYPALTLKYMSMPGDRPLLENHELNSIGYFVFFLLLGMADVKWRKEKG